MSLSCVLSMLFSLPLNVLYGIQCALIPHKKSPVFCDYPDSDVNEVKENFITTQTQM